MKLKNIFAITTVSLFALSCHSGIKDYVTLSGRIENQNSDSVMVRSRAYNKTIKVDEKGHFKDTLKVDSGKYSFFDGKEQTTLFLKNGYNLKIRLNTDEFDETIAFKGKGAEANNYLAKKALLQETLLYDFSIYDLDREVFDQKTNAVFQEMQSKLTQSNNLDEDFVSQENKQIAQLKKSLTSNYDDKQYMITVLSKGKVSPAFVNYSNYKGGTTSLSDLKGKYVYIDVWATWCGPCKAEIPYLKEIEKAYHGRNIEFVSISVDKHEDKQKWEDMIQEKDLGGIQLLADKDFRSDFVQNYAIRGIPRFILIDTNGNIMDANAPRPSDNKLKTLFDAL